MLLWPAHTQQQLLRTRLIGDRFWWHVSKQRRAAFPGQIDIWEILQEDDPFDQLNKRAAAANGGASPITGSKMPRELKEKTGLGDDEYKRYVEASNVAAVKRSIARKHEKELAKMPREGKRVRVIDGKHAGREGLITRVAIDNSGRLGVRLDDDAPGRPPRDLARAKVRVLTP